MEATTAHAMQLLVVNPPATEMIAMPVAQGLFVLEVAKDIFQARPSAAVVYNAVVLGSSAQPLSWMRVQVTETHVRLEAAPANANGGERLVLQIQGTAGAGLQAHVEMYFEVVSSPLADKDATLTLQLSRRQQQRRNSGCGTQDLTLRTVVLDELAASFPAVFLQAWEMDELTCDVNVTLGFTSGCDDALMLARVDTQQQLLQSLTAALEPSYQPSILNLSIKDQDCEPSTAVTIMFTQSPPSRATESTSTTTATFTSELSAVDAPGSAISSSLSQKTLVPLLVVVAALVVCAVIFLALVVHRQRRHGEQGVYNVADMENEAAVQDVRKSDRSHRLGSQQQFPSRRASLWATQDFRGKDKDHWSDALHHDTQLEWDVSLPTGQPIAASTACSRRPSTHSSTVIAPLGSGAGPIDPNPDWEESELETYSSYL